MICRYTPEQEVTITCPETGIRTRVFMGWDADGDPVVTGCLRFWGGLLCEAACWKEAVTEFDLLDVAREPQFYNCETS
jgi:hypothetical protein